MKDSITKFCKSCETEKPIGDFYWNRVNNCRAYQCKECEKKRKIENRRNSPIQRALAVLTAATWKRNNPEKAKQNARNVKATRRARKQSGRITTGEWLDLCAKYDNRCLCCGEVKELTLDHVIPLAKGGENVIGNAQPLCALCNSRKGTKIIDYR